MAPSIVSGYSKNLDIFPDCISRQKNRVGYLVSPVYDVLRLIEWKLTGSPYAYCVTVSIVGGEDNGWLRELALDRSLEGDTEEEIVHYIRVTVGEDEDDEDKQVARFVYRNFLFRTKAGNDAGIQIKGAFVEPAKEKRAMARTVYAFLLNWHRHVISDDHQTVFGAKIWANGMIQSGRVQVYDASQKHFVDILTQGGEGIGGFKPWDALLLSEQQISHWNPYALSIDPADQILAIVSATDRYHNIGITTFDATLPRLIIH
ncbi:hypothetical protein [Erwinia sp. E_sp_B04_7]|uniref:hypothetical protein n=1 Tax=unclassified Erwinia TaxID=2622719 RepID=UPI0030D5F19C